ncbi:hypothetical protein BaRGS_00039962 [Batillaria attramentaria]|uniref:Cyclin-dependent kinase 7 n=1 Tax=Batillaria attramentaria TaxID=370345 RepID=A0ABD0J1U5_9CAEN
MSDDSNRRYEKIEFLGEGQFATVYKARDTKTDGIVAVKKIKIGTRAEAADGINRTALREIKLLQELTHQNIIGLLDVFGHKSNVSLVFDFMETDLEIIIKDSKIILTAPHIKSYMLQTCLGLEYLHTHWILHRDMKPNNLLLNEQGVLKIADFGLAKFFGSPSRANSHQVVTRWYRSPELLFGARQYSTGVDMWATGCILAELLIRAPFLPGDSDLDQLSRIFQVLGTPGDADWPDMKHLPDYIQFRQYPRQPLKEIFIAAGDDLLEVLGAMLAMDPLRRCTATQALKMPYFSNKPPPAPGHQLPRPGSNRIVNKEQEARRAGLKRKQNSDQGARFHDSVGISGATAHREGETGDSVESEDTLQGHSDDHNFDENCSHVMACAVITSPSVHWNLSVEQLPWHDRRPGETGHLSPKTKLAWNSLSRFEDSTRGSVDTKPNFEDTEGDHQDTDSAFDECDSPLEVGDPCSEDSESISQDPNTKSLDLDSVPLKMKICEIFQSCPGGGILNSVDYICLFPRERPDCHSKDGTTRNKHNNRLHRVVTSEKRHPWTFEQGAVYQHVNGHINECIVKGVTFAQPPFPELSTKRRNEGNDRWPQQEKVASGSLRRQEGNAKSSQEKLGNGKSSQDKVGSGKSSQEKLGSGKSSQDKVGSGKSSQEKLGSGKSSQDKDKVGSGKSSQEKLGSGKSSQDKVGSGKSSQEKLGSGKSSQERLAGRSWLSSSTVRAVLLIILTTGNCWSVGAAKNQLRGLRCPPCRQIHCAIRDPKELDCPGGVSTGVCGCCPVCARLAGQSCGGDWSYLGKCDRGLTCRTPAQPTAPVYPTQKEPAGVCVKGKGP